MITCPKKIIFLHPTKTGGTSVLEALNTSFNITKNHLPLHSGIKVKKRKDSSLFVFAICRNPYDRVISMYNFFEVARNMSFSVFLNYLEKMRDQHVFFCPQYKYTKYQGFEVDDIIRLEHMEEDWKRVINDKLAIPVAVLHANKDKTRRKQLLNEVEKQMIYRLYREDFQYLEYSK